MIHFATKYAFLERKALANEMNTITCGIILLQEEAKKIPERDLNPRTSGYRPGVLQAELSRLSEL
jgi:hypothetical protein